MDNFKVSLVKYMCPICGGVAERGNCGKHSPYKRKLLLKVEEFRWKRL